MNDLDLLQHEYDNSLKEYMLARKRQRAVKKFIKSNDQIDDAAEPLTPKPIRGGWYGDFIEKENFMEGKWSLLMEQRKTIDEIYPGAYPVRYIDYIKNNIYPLSVQNQQIECSDVLIYGLCDTISFTKEGYNLHLCDPFNETILFVPNDYKKDYIMSLSGNTVIANIYIDTDYLQAYSDACGYKAEVPIELETKDIAVFGDKVSFEGTMYEDLDEPEDPSLDFGF